MLRVCPRCHAPLRDGEQCVYCYTQERALQKIVAVATATNEDDLVERNGPCPTCGAPLFRQGRCTWCQECGWGTCS